MHFLVDANDRAGSAQLRRDTRALHLEYVSSHVQSVLAAGAKLDGDGTTVTGSFFILDVGSSDQAKEFVDNDPYTLSKVFETVTITAWRKSFFNYEHCEE